MSFLKHMAWAQCALWVALANGCGGDSADPGLPGYPNDAASQSTGDAAVIGAGNTGVGGTNGNAGATLGGGPGVGRSDGGAADSGVTGPNGGGGPAEVGLDGEFSKLTAPLPVGKDYNGWTWVDVAGAKCRDGSGAGYYWRRGKTPSVMVFLNGGGACADPFFCGLNPVNVNQNLPIELLIGGTLNLIVGPDAERQVAPDEGVFKRDPRNPVADWNMIYVPYCTGDIHAGSREDVVVEGVDGKQQFVGYKNLGLFLKSFGPSFMNARQVLLTGSSAGGFGSLLNYDRFQEFFKGQEVLAISDSGLPMRDKYMAACLQAKWRKYWGLTDAFPKDCTACQGDAGGLTEAAFKYYFTTKYKDKFLGGLITTVNDQIIRAFFAPGLSSTSGAPDDCTLEPGLNTVTSALFLGQYDGNKYREGIVDVMDNLVGPGQIGVYAMEGELHMHLFRSRFYEKNGNAQSIAEWMKDIIEKKPTKTGDNFLHVK